MNGGITCSVSRIGSTTLKDAVHGLIKSDIKGVTAGVVSGATSEAGGMGVAQYAMENEYGTLHIPKRPFMRTAFELNFKKWVKIANAGLRTHLKKNRPLYYAFTATGRVAMADIQAQILSNMPPPNNPDYLAKKQKMRTGGGYIGTLFNKGTLFNSILYELRS